MGRINMQRVVVGGLLAGVVFNVGEFLNGLVFGDRYNAAMAALGKTMPETTGVMIYWIIIGLLFGIALVWLYAAIRPRFGAGARTAAYAGLAMWVFTSAFRWLGEGPLGLWPTDVYVVATLWWLVLLPLSTVVGAWQYREAPAGMGGAM